MKATDTLITSYVVDFSQKSIFCPKIMYSFILCPRNSSILFDISHLTQNLLNSVLFNFQVEGTFVSF